MIDELKEYASTHKLEEKLMTREEAIDRLQSIKSKVSLYKDVVALRMAEEALKSQKTGHWIFKNDNIAIPTGYYQCSECEEGKSLNKDNFCPNCGAKMEGVSNEL